MYNSPEEKNRNVYIETYGCSSSKNDSEIMAGLLSKGGFEVVSNIELADVVIVNTCIVKQVTENKIRFRISRIQKEYPEKRLIIAGCMPEAEYEIARKIAPSASLVSTNKVTDIVKVVGKASKQRVELLGRPEKEKICLPKIRKNPVVDIVEICSGCNYACSYCITKLAKGALYSYPPEKIAEEIAKMHNNGCKEFWITGQDVASYNYKGLRLPGLINKITHVKGRYFLRLGMMNPAEVLPVLGDLIKAYQQKQVFKFIHIPVQSGSNRILSAMNRNYSVDDFKKIISAFRSAFPDITVWTDVIVGFPGENENDFEESLDLIEKTGPDFVNVSQFAVRPGTKAAKMKQIPTEIKKERSRRMAEIAEKMSMKANEKWLSWSGLVLIDEYNCLKKNYIGRNASYKPVSVKQGPLGDFIDVKISSVEKTCLVSEK